MGWNHRLSNINPEERTGICSTCGPVTIRRSTSGKFSGGFHWRCNPGHPGGTKGRRLFRRSVKQDKCQRCGFLPEHGCQLDINHKDGNKRNNDLSNLETLCANCHRLVTYLAKHWLNKYEAPSKSQGPHS